jgi:hypothetical protein
MPVFVAHGDSDPMILPHYSYLLAGLIRQARSRSTPTRPTGSCSSTLAADVEAFLSEPPVAG